ncbi:MAG: hypothetical protein FWB93_04815 [Oscillospiraceae bacterium]|nr:hypothetical protein [Oscillospiraceae bacterium]
MKKRIFAGCLGVIFAFVIFTSCDIFDHGIDKLVIVAGVAIDQGEDEKYRVTAELTRIEGGALEGNVVPQAITKEGATIPEALAKIEWESGDKLHLGHCELILLSRDIARQGIADIIDLWMGLPKYSPLAVVAVSTKDTAEELLQSEEEEEDNQDVMSNLHVKRLLPQKRVYQVHRDLMGGEEVLLAALPKGVALIEDGRLTKTYGKDDAPYAQMAYGEFTHAALTFRNPDVTIDFYFATTRRKNGVLHIHLTGSSSEYQDSMEKQVKSQIIEKLGEVTNDKVEVRLSVRRESRGEA